MDAVSHLSGYCYVVATWDVLKRRDFFLHIGISPLPKLQDLQPTMTLWSHEQRGYTDCSNELKQKSNMLGR